MKRLLYIIAGAAVLLAACKKDHTSSSRDVLYINNDYVAAQGSYVQGATLNDLSTVVIPYRNAKGGTATISAPESNGMSITEQTVQMASGNGEAVVKVSGMPMELTNTILQINLVYMGSTYITSVEIPVTMDPDPTGTITFTIDQSDIVSLADVTVIPFTVDPSMTAVVVSSAAINGLAVKVDQDFSAGTGTVTLTPSGLFLSGQLQLTATFGVRPTQTATINVNGFDGGDGATAPYLISTPDQFAKIASGLTMKYQLTGNLSLGTVMPVAGTFTGSLDGNGKTVDFTVNTPTTNNAALFSTLGAGASISNLTLTGNVTGQDNVAALAAANNGATITSVDASGVAITGHNNVALLSASGTSKDAAVLTFTNPPTSVNITQGTLSASVALGLTPVNAAVTVDLLATNLQSYAYSTTTGQLTLTMPAVPSTFVAGDISVSAKLAASGAGSNVSSTPYTIAVMSAKMYESGTGVAGDPYMVMNMDQLVATMAAYPSAYISLMNDIPTTNWASIASFSGTFDGAGFAITGLTAPFVATNAGTIQNVKFTGVNIVTPATGNIGVVANSSSGIYNKVAVTGTLTRTTAAGGDQPTGGVIGEMTGGSVTDSYTNLAITATGNHGGGIVGRCSGSAVTKTITKCTTAGTLTASTGTAFGGILGRILTGSGAVTVSNCSSSMGISVTASTSNMVGGIFGACQASTTNTYKIDQCQFTGSVDATASGGGISGVGCLISNCIVIGSGSSAATANVRSGETSGNYPGAGINAAVKDNIANCIVVNSRIASASSLTGSARNPSGICTDQNANAPTVSGCVLLNTSLPDNGRTIIGDNATLNAAFGAVSNNFYSGVTYFSNGTNYTPTGVAAIDGTPGPATMDQAWYTSIGYDFTTPIWQWGGSYPVLVSAGCDAAVIP